ncbi:MAG: hypothetical protein AB7U98_06130 [Candidatus Nitrosocosmicus sp.]
MKYIYLIFISFFLAFLTQLINANATSNRFDYALKNMSTEIEDSLFNVTQPSHSIGDALTTSSLISNKTLDQEKVVNGTIRETNQPSDESTQHLPSIRDALTTSSLISNKTLDQEK